MTHLEQVRKLLRIARLLLSTWGRQMETIDQVPDALTPNEPRVRSGPTPRPRKKQVPITVRMKLEKNRVDVYPQGANRRVDLPNTFRTRPELIDTVGGKFKEYLG